MPLSAQEKLALIMTSAGSQRHVAALVGISHQRVGRYLREGEPGGARAIPDDPGLLRAIDVAYDIHVDIAREQARAQGVPFDSDVPVYVERKYLSRPDKNGNPQLGDRVISGNTEFIRRELRDEWIRSVVESERFYKVNVRSQVSIRDYFWNVALEENRRTPFNKGRTVERVTNILLRNFIEKERSRRPNVIIDVDEPFALFTQDESTMPGAEPWRVVAGVEDMLSQKHSPAVTGKGNKLAHEYLTQLIPANYVRPKRKRAVRVTRGRGPK